MSAKLATDTGQEHLLTPHHCGKTSRSGRTGRPCAHPLVQYHIRSRTHIAATPSPCDHSLSGCRSQQGFSNGRDMSSCSPAVLATSVLSTSGCTMDVEATVLQSKLKRYHVHSDHLEHKPGTGRPADKTPLMPAAPTLILPVPSLDGAMSHMHPSPEIWQTALQA